MPRNRDEPPAVRVYTVCDESRCKPMDEEDCEPFTDVYWIKFLHVKSARFAKRKLDESVFLANRLQVSYAPQFESLSDTKEKLECRRKEVLARLNSGKSHDSKSHNPNDLFEPPFLPSPTQTSITKQMNSNRRNDVKPDHTTHIKDPPIRTVSSNEEYFPTPSMNATVQLVREKLDKIQSSSAHLEAGPASKKARVDNRRRI